MDPGEEKRWRPHGGGAARTQFSSSLLRREPHSARAHNPYDTLWDLLPAICFSHCGPPSSSVADLPSQPSISLD